MVACTANRCGDVGRAKQRGGKRQRETYFDCLRDWIADRNMGMAAGLPRTHKGRSTSTVNQGKGEATRNHATGRKLLSNRDTQTTDRDTLPRQRVRVTQRWPYQNRSCPPWRTPRATQPAPACWVVGRGSWVWVRERRRQREMGKHTTTGPTQTERATEHGLW